MASFITAKEIIFIAIKSNKIKVIFILYYSLLFSLIFLNHIIINNKIHKNIIFYILSFLLFMKNLIYTFFFHKFLF